MAADPQKPKEKEGDKPEPTKSRKLKPLLLVSISAVIGGAGLPWLLPKPVTQTQSAPRAPEYELVQPLEKMEFIFNPKVERAMRSATVSFFFVIKQQKGEQEEQRIHKLIKDHWDRARSRVLEVLTGHTAQELSSVEGKQHLRKQIASELTETFFLHDEATVEDVLWDKFVVL